MESGRILRNSQIIILGVCIALATIASSVILSQGFMKLMKFSKEVISVTGSARKRSRAITRPGRSNSAAAATTSPRHTRT